MADAKTIEFEFTFRYPDRGNYLDATAVTVKAPGMSNFRVHSAMHGWVMDAMMQAAAKAIAASGGIEAARKRAEAEEDKPTADEPTEPSGTEFIDQIAIGLGPEKFAEFMAFTRKALTGNAHLAWVGDKRPITDEVWLEIETNGGMEAVMEVMGTFAGFFVVSRKSPKKTGDDKLITSSSPTKAPSLPNGSRPRRLPS